jgi:hypothetical protein
VTDEQRNDHGLKAKASSLTEWAKAIVVLGWFVLVAEAIIVWGDGKLGEAIFLVVFCLALARIVTEEGWWE